MHLARFDIDLFLRDYWQRQPLLIRNPWADWRNPLEPDELAGLACEEGIESRLIVHGENGLALENGPLPEARFADLAGQIYTLLVQAVDHHVPQVAALIEPFRFVPDWRIDDVMVSYAVTGGGVGPHFDQYDVFLVQGLGQLRWRVGPVCNDATPLHPHADLRLLQGFDTVAEWDLGPGDILYVPPGVAHDGVALSDDCMTYSVGFRAPSVAELVDGWADHCAAALPEDRRYADPGLMRQAHPAEITAPALDRLQALVLEALSDRAEFARWFASHASQPKYPEIDWQPEETFSPDDVRGLLAEGAALERNPASRFAFVRQDGGATLLAVNGETWPCTGAAAELAVQVCDGPAFTPAPDQPDEVLALIAALANAGALAFV